MSRHALTLELDPAIRTSALIEAHEAPATDFAAIVARLDTTTGAQDDLDELGAGGVTPESPAAALGNAERLSTSDKFVGVGYCLRTVRQDEFRIPGLYPDAETAWEQADLRHLTSDPAAIPRGGVPFWENGRYGHVALGAGGGMCWTTDYRRPGFVDLAPIAALAGWCGGRLVGWAEDVNGYDLWPDAPKPVRPWDIEDRIRFVRHALRTARQKGSPARRVNGLKHWLDQLEARKAAHDQKGTR